MTVREALWLANSCLHLNLKHASVSPQGRTTHSFPCSLAAFAQSTTCRTAEKRRTKQDKSLRAFDMQAQFSHEDRITNSEIHHTMLESSESSARKEPSSFRLQRACICILLKSRESSCRTTASVALQPANEASNAPWGYSRLRTRTRQPGPEIDKKNGLTFWVSKLYLSKVSQLVSV
jgi:hypothetical protein